MSVSPSDIPALKRSHSVTEIRQWIVAEIALALKVQPSEVDSQALLDSHGLDSLAAINIVSKLSTFLDRRLTATLFWDCPTVEAMARKLADHDEPEPAPLPQGVIAMQRGGDRTPIFFFPGVGGHPVTFMALAGALGPHQPGYGLTVPGLNGLSEPLTSVESIATVMVQTLRRVQPKGPYQLAGYSFGGLLAFEAGRQLEQAGESVSMLAIYDAFAPGGRVARPLWQRLALHGYLLVADNGRRDYLREHADRLRGKLALDPDDAEDASADNQNPSQAVQDIQAINRRAAEVYGAGDFSGSILWFVASDRQRHNIFYKFDRQGGWGKFAAGGVRMIKLPGSHFTILDADHAPGAAEMLKPFLAQSAAEQPAPSRS